jgi:hypothetical protein
MIKSAEEFAKLRCSTSRAEQMRASEEEAPLDVWLEVVATFPELREWVAQNKTVPLAVLEQLARDADAKVRRVVAGKRKLTPELRGQLARDTDSSVRARVVYNGKCEISVLRLLAADSEPFVKEAAAKKLAERDGVASA